MIIGRSRDGSHLWYRDGDIYAANRYVWRGESRTVRLSRMRYMIFLCLLLRRYCVVSREEILDNVYPANNLLLWPESTLKEHVYLMRKQLAPLSLTIVSHYGRGYELR